SGASPTIADQIPENREQPGFQIGAQPKAMRGPERLQIGLLRQVFRVRDISRKPVSGTIDALTMAQRFRVETLPPIAGDIARDWHDNWNLRLHLPPGFTVYSSPARLSYHRRFYSLLTPQGAS